mgnify:CR=1 FL=1
MIKLNKKLQMSKADIAKLEQLRKEKPNLPDTKLTPKEKSLVSDLYYKYIIHIDNKDWTLDLWKLEKKENWPSGPRVKEHEAMRFILDNLYTINTHKPNMTNREASEFFLGLLKGVRESYQILTYYCYSERV